MHPNPAYRTTDRQRNLAFARERAFGLLAISADGAPLMAHVPFLLRDDVAQLHLLRSNPIARALQTPQAARIAVSGPDAYVSPDWYDMSDQVPTWNYVAVHLTGLLELRPQQELRDLLDRQSALLEERLLPKPIWSTAKMDKETLDRMMRQIVPCRMRITDVEGTWKLSQNKPDPARLGAADQMEAFGTGLEPRMLAALMRGAGGQG